jgi:HK97 family phage prohead protease
MKRETRRAELRAADLGDGRPGVTLKVITPNVVDDYGSVFEPSAFDASLGQRNPVMCWAHSWEEPLGPYVDHTTGDDGAPVIRFAFSDFDAVPMARRAHAQVLDGTIGDCSVGFSNTKRRDPTDDELTRWPGVREVITSADLDEVSLVLRGAVPGAKVLSVRSGGAVDVDAVVEIAKRISAGELSDAEGKVALDLLAAGEPPAPPAADPEPPVVVDAAELVALDAALDGALDSIGRSASR